ncbi:hypothetical protein GH714_010874 [Hevea brasiliensis]|uniref:Uncharacterized protein n=1 Tax=Hevea brasiliensis TaxID=3981 RepID=A0A6A6KQW5_HEVBR|nr:hypothetical protein GH714_010874 [Hevea brasiliensis]
MSFKDKLFFGNGEGGDVLMGDNDDESDVGSDSEGKDISCVREAAHIEVMGDLNMEPRQEVSKKWGEREMASGSRHGKNVNQKQTKREIVQKNKGQA